MHVTRMNGLQINYAHTCKGLRSCAQNISFDASGVHAKTGMERAGMGWRQGQRQRVREIGRDGEMDLMGSIPKLRFGGKTF